MRERVGRVIEGINLIKIQYIHRNTMAKPLWTVNSHQTKNEEECKTGPIRGWVLTDEGG
jgi:hypothetical protein